MALAPLLSRPWDILAVGFFASHIVFAFLIDLQAIFGAYYPAPLVDLNSACLLSVCMLFDRTPAWYAREFADPFMGASPAPLWFRSFIYAEAFLQLPFFFAAVQAFWKGILSVC